MDRTYLRFFLGQKEPTGSGFGIDQLITRRVFAIHPVGFAAVEAGFAGITPTDAELILAAAWNRVYNAENCPFVVVKHKLA